MAGIMRDCPDCPDICQDRHRKIYDLLYRVRDAAGGAKGLVSRYAEQIAPDASGPGTSVWKGHERAIRNQQTQLKKELRRYDNSRVENDQGGKDPCPPPPLIQEAREWAERPVPTAAEWEANNPRLQSMRDTGQLNNPSPSVGDQVLYGVGAIILGIGAGLAFLCPLDGPLGEVALGSGAVGLWALASNRKHR